MFPDNNWYGHRKILLKYLGIDDVNIFVSLQHGWKSQFFKNTRPYKKKLYPILFWSNENINFLNKEIIKNVYSIGAPFLYLCKMIEIRSDKKKIKVNPSRGTIVFPSHSSQDLSQETDHNLLIKDIEEKFEGPYTICFYYYDLSQKDITIYKKKNWHITCCTRSRTDKHSLYRQYIEINKHNTIVCGEFNTTLFYSMYLKKNTCVHLDSNKRFDSYDQDEKQFVRLYKKEYPELFDSFLSPNKGYELGKKELGYDCMKEKKELKKLLGCNSSVKLHLSKLFSILYDLKYGSGLREGKDISKENLKKHIEKASRN